jgi:hypothetical protein
MLTKGGLFRTGNEEERFHAALALVWLGTPTALAVLHRELQGKRDVVRKAVDAALQVVRAAAQREGSEQEETVIVDPSAEEKA